MRVGSGSDTGALSDGRPRRRRSAGPRGLIVPPACEHRQRIKNAAVVGLTAAMLGEKIRHLPGIEEASVCSPRGVPRFVGEVAEIASEPIAQRHLESEFAAR